MRRMDPPGAESPAMNEPDPRFLATLSDLHGPPLGESPIGAWATLEPSEELPDSPKMKRPI
jgi:hypothetical protein